MMYEFVFTLFVFIYVFLFLPSFIKVLSHLNIKLHQK